MGPVSFSALLIALPLTLASQRQASLGVGAGVVRYSGGSSFSALSVAPAGQWVSPSSYLDANGAVSLLEAGVWAGQGRVDVWAALSRPAANTRLAVNATIAASTRSDGLAAGSGVAVLEAVHGIAGTKGDGGAAVGAGPVTGVIENFPGVGALRLRGRGWWRFRDSPAQFSLTLEGTRLLGAWYTDGVAGVVLDERRVVGSLWVSGRVSQAYTSSAAASVSLQYFATPAIAVEASGGNYLRDPFQGLPTAGFVTAGVRFFRTPRASRTTHSSSAPQRPLLGPLVATHRGGDTVVVRFRMPAAHGVAIAGNWNAWTPAPLQGLGEDIWEAALRLPPGTYYFNLVVDGREWVVPGGVATIPDGMGGLIAVLNVL
ncbi:MAG TPA: glycogen-binding domain-containing protein [Gemmatimonadales bacterium]|nr:glycogen-binding domain-containing protein [Gemmatimonadales bacterium]